MVGGIHIEPLDLDRSLAQDHRRLCIEPQLKVGDQSAVGFGDPSLATRLTNLRELQSLAVVRCAMQLHVRGGIRLRECSAEDPFGEHRKLQSVMFLRSPDPNRGLHQSTRYRECVVAANSRALRPLSASLPEHWNFRPWPGAAIMSRRAPTRGLRPVLNPKETVASVRYGAFRRRPIYLVTPPHHA